MRHLIEYQKEFIDKRFGNLIVKDIFRDKEYRGIKCLCICDCGNNKIISADRLRCGGSKSCGCKHGPKRHPDETVCVNHIMAIYKRCARDKNIKFELEYSEFIKLIKNKCFYCGIIPSNILHIRDRTYIYNGIDRVDNFRGYVLNNVVSCCIRCNQSKMDMSVNEFKDWLKSVYDHMRLGNNNE